MLIARVLQWVNDPRTPWLHTEPFVIFAKETWLRARYVVMRSPNKDYWQDVKTWLYEEIRASVNCLQLEGPLPYDLPYNPNRPVDKIVCSIDARWGWPAPDRST